VQLASGRDACDVIRKKTPCINLTLRPKSKWRAVKISWFNCSNAEVMEPVEEK